MCILLRRTIMVGRVRRWPATRKEFAMNPLLIEQIGQQRRQEDVAGIERHAEARVVRVTSQGLPVFSDFFRRRYGDGRTVRRESAPAVLISGRPAYRLS
jgi:hypothetical protein